MPRFMASRKIFPLLMSISSMNGSEPAQLAALALLEAGDIGLVAQRQAHLVDALQQALLAERVDLETIDLPVGAGHGLRGKVDRDRRTRRGMQERPQPRRPLGRQTDRHDAVLEAVVEEDVAERRSDEGP